VEFILGWGIVTAIDNAYIDSRGINVPQIHLKSALDGQTLMFPWTPMGSDQKMPMRGMAGIYATLGAFGSRILCCFGLNGPNIRKGSQGLAEGEFQVQSDSGFGYFKGTADGGVSMASGDANAIAKGDSTGWDFQSSVIQLSSFAGASVQLGDDGSIALQQADANGNVLASMTMDANHNFTANLTQGTFTVKAPKIIFDGDCVFGPGAGNPTAALTAGNAVTSGPGGTYPLDFTTKAPIPGTPNVKIVS
jgi:hypothetical protein